MKAHKFTYPKSNGFTLLELVVVIIGIGILATLSAPSIIKFLSESKIDQAKSILNSAAAECIQMYRATGPTALTQRPSILDRADLPEGYSFIDGKDKCQNLAIEDPTSADSLLVTLGLYVDDASGGPIVKKWSIYKHPDTRYSCEQWGGCGEGENIQAIIAEQNRRAEEQARLAAIEERYNAWLKGPPPGTGNYTADGKNIWAFQGRVLADEAKFNQVVEQECGKELTDALNNAKNTKFDGPFSYTGKSGGCSISTYLCSGKDVGSKDGYDACKEEERQTRCTAAEGRWKDSGVNGKFSEPGCEVKWQCNREIFLSQNDYDNTVCAKPITPVTPVEPVKSCKLPDIWYCPVRPTRPECQPICN